MPPGTPKTPELPLVSPWVRLARRILWVLRESLVGFFRDDAMFYAAGIAFYSLFSIFSALLLSSLLLGLLGSDPENLRFLALFMDGLAPDEASKFVENILNIVSRPAPGKLLPLAMLITLWTASNAFQAIIHALNRIYHLREVRAAWRTRLIALSLAGGGALLLTLGFVLFMFGGDITSGFSRFEWIQGHAVGFILTYKRPLAFVTVFVASYLLYWLAPKFDQGQRVALPGAVFLALSWLLVTAAFKVYLRELAVYDRVFGPMATLVVVVVWIQVSAQLALFGGEVNAVIQRRQRERTAASQ